MEIATLSGLAPGRVVAGIGHGVQVWMEQMGARTPSPVATLHEGLTVIRRLLEGEEVTFHGNVHHLDAVRLGRPPDPVPPVLAGVQGPRSLEMAGVAADGLVLAELSGPTYVRWAIDRAGSPPGFDVAVFVPVHVDRDRAAARRSMAPWLASMVGSPNRALERAPFHDELLALVAEGGADAVATMPDEWWTELCAVGDPDDVAAVVEAGATRISFFPSPQRAIARQQLSRVTTDVIPLLRALDVGKV